MIHSCNVIVTVKTREITNETSSHNLSRSPLWLEPLPSALPRRSGVRIRVSPSGLPPSITADTGPDFRSDSTIIYARKKSSRDRQLVRLLDPCFRIRRQAVEQHDYSVIGGRKAIICRPRNEGGVIPSDTDYRSRRPLWSDWTVPFLSQKARWNRVYSRNSARRLIVTTVPA